MKKWGIRLIVVVLLVIGVYSSFYFYTREQYAKISTYEECVAGGFPILESYPSQCHVPNGKSFTQNIGNELEYSHEFTLENPRPNQKISSPIEISGKARGIWYFEGSFSGELFDGNKKSLGTVILTAQGEWMTEDFVPFKGQLIFQNTATDKGELIIKNANPSGLPENEKTLTIPVTF